MSCRLRHQRAWAVRRARGTPGSFRGAPRASWNVAFLWQRPLLPLVSGSETGPLALTGIVADGTNPQANSGARGLVYINSDLSLYLHRPPTGEWICLEVTGHQADSGIAVGSATFHDVTGPFGQAMVGALANNIRR